MFEYFYLSFLSIFVRVAIFRLVYHRCGFENQTHTFAEMERTVMENPRRLDFIGTLISILITQFVFPIKFYLLALI